MNRASKRCAPVRALVLSALLAGSLPALAQSAAPTAPAVPSSTAMSIPQLIEHLGSSGYRDFKEVERKGDKLYEVKARDGKGLWVELYVDARSGEILRSEVDR